MLTDEQYHFLKDFDNEAEKSKNENKIRNFKNEKKINAKELEKLLESHPNLFSGEPYHSSKNE